MCKLLILICCHAELSVLSCSLKWAIVDHGSLFLKYNGDETLEEPRTVIVQAQSILLKCLIIIIAVGLDSRW